MALAETNLATVLVIEDAAELRHLLEIVLMGEGFDVAVATSGVTAIERARDLTPDVVVLDLDLPDIDGIEVIRRIRGFSPTHVVMLASCCDQVDRLRGVRIGADDYLRKPFVPAELAERIRTVMRQPHRAEITPVASGPGRVRVGEVEIDTVAGAAFVDGCDIDLTTTEFQILGTLAMRPSMVFTRQMLLEHVWDDESADHDTVDVEVANLRRKLDGNGSAHIRTVRGVGYRMA